MRILLLARIVPAFKAVIAGFTVCILQPLTPVLRVIIGRLTVWIADKLLCHTHSRGNDERD